MILPLPYCLVNTELLFLVLQPFILTKCFGLTATLSLPFDIIQDNCLTRVKSLHIAVKKADIHASHVDDIEQGCDDHAPDSKQHSNQDIDRKQQICQQEEITPVR